MTDIIFTSGCRENLESGTFQETRLQPRQRNINLESLECVCQRWDICASIKAENCEIDIYFTTSKSDSGIPNDEKPLLATKSFSV